MHRVQMSGRSARTLAPLTATLVLATSRTHCPAAMTHEPAGPICASAVLAQTARSPWSARSGSVSSACSALSLPNALSHPALLADSPRASRPATLAVLATRVRPTRAARRPVALVRPRRRPASTFHKGARDRLRDRCAGLPAEDRPRARALAQLRRRRPQRRPPPKARSPTTLSRTPSALMQPSTVRSSKPMGIANRISDPLTTQADLSPAAGSVGVGHCTRARVHALAAGLGLSLALAIASI